MRWIAILVAVAAGASAFTPGASSKKLLRATPENALSKSIAKGAGQVALAVALLSPAAAAYGYSSDRQLKVTFGANNPTYFDLPAKASPKGTPFFGGSKEPRTLFKPPKPRVPPRLSRLRATRPRLRAQDPRVQETAASAPPRPRASRVGPSHRAAAPQVSESGWRSKTKGCERAPPTRTSIAPSDSRAKWRGPGKEGRSPSRPEPGARCSPYPVYIHMPKYIRSSVVCASAIMRIEVGSWGRRGEGTLGAGAAARSPARPRLAGRRPVAADAVRAHSMKGARTEIRVRSRILVFFWGEVVAA